MKRRLIAAMCLVAVALAPSCSRDGAPNSLFDTAGYHVSGDTVYYLNAFPGSAFQIDGADPASFEAFNSTYARDNTRVYVNGVALPDADAASFELLDRPGFAKDRSHVYQHDRTISSDPAHFEILAAELTKDSSAVYWADGSVLSDDPAHFEIIADNNHYLYSKDSHTVHVNGNAITGAEPESFRVLAGGYSRDDNQVFYFTGPIADAETKTFAPLEGPYAADAKGVYWMGNTIAGADPSTFRVLNANFECSADARRAYYRQTVITDADPQAFPAGRDVTGCSATTISFA